VGPRVPGIWIAVVREGVLHTLLQPGSRDAAARWLLTRVAEPTPTVVGVDFAFGFPAWWCAVRGWHDAAAVWRAAEAEGEAWLAACAPPFWGRPGRLRPHEHDRGLRATDLRLGITPKSVFQIGGAGAVGTGSVRGMPLLGALRKAGAAIWPMDAPALHTVLEIYPRILTPAGTVKRDAASRARALAEFDARMLPSAARATATASEDAFDTVLSAFALQQHRAEVSLRTRPRDALSQLEGQVWAPPSARAATAR
jgi:hypothetical protein